MPGALENPAGCGIIDANRDKGEIGMAAYIISFSPTGGTDKVLDILGEAFAPLERIDLMKDGNLESPGFKEEDLCLVGVPVYGGRVPATAAERLAKLKGRGARAVAVAVYGNRDYEDALLELKDILSAGGFRIAAGVAANAEHSIMRRFGAGRPDAADRAQLEDFARRIREELELRPDKGDVELPGKRPYKKYGVISMVPRAGVDCKGCGACARRCPVGAISPEEPRLVDESKCICCMACVAACPTGARALDPERLEAMAQRLESACGGRKENSLFL